MRRSTARRIHRSQRSGTRNSVPLRTSVAQVVNLRLVFSHHSLAQVNNLRYLRISQEKGKEKMITRRDIVVALVTGSVSLAIGVLARSDTPVMSSSVFEWNSVPVKPTK